MASSGSESDEEVEAEPILKYNRIGLDVTEMLTRDSASCIRAHEKFLVIGTQNGFIYILDLNGNEIKRFYAHSMPVNEVSVDITGEYVCSCSDDGLVVVSALYAEDNLEFTGHEPVKTVAIDPAYVQRDTRELVMGGLDGQLMRKEKGWFGNMRDFLVHGGEGPIHAIRWEGEFIAWANEIGVKIYDCNLKSRITHLKRPQGSLDTDHRPRLCWANGRTLLIGWADSIQAVEVRKRDQQQAAMGLPVNYVTIIAQFTLPDAVCCGIAPHGQDLAVLCHVTDDGDLAEERPRPELRILDQLGAELSCDALSIHGYAELESPNEYQLDFIESEKLFYISTPQDVLVATNRDNDDHIHWLLDNGREKEALAAAQEGGATRHSVQEVGSMYLHTLTEQGQWSDAATKCHELLTDAEHWNRWIFVFAHAGQLSYIAHYIPTDKPRLQTEVYEMVLSDFLKQGSTANDHTQFLDLIERWPKGVYRRPPVLELVREAVKRSGVTSPPTLCKALAMLYSDNNQHPYTLDIYLYMYKSGPGKTEKATVTADQIFEYIEKHKLHEKAVQRVNEIVQVDADRGVRLLIRHATADTKALYDIVTQLKSEPRLLHKYLKAIWEADLQPDQIPGYQKTPKDYHDDMVQLFADHEPDKLEAFLRKSTSYNLDLALELCRKGDLKHEVVFLLGRSDRNKDALNMILNDLDDIEKALKFVKERNDEELWEMLIERGATDPKSLSKLLDTAGSHIDPIVIIERIPSRLEIPDLRDKIVKIIKDYTAQMSLHEGCGRVLKSDNVDLCQKAAKERTRAAIWDVQNGESASTAPATRRDGEGRWTPNGEPVAMAAGARGRGGGSATWYFQTGAGGDDDDEEDGGRGSPRGGSATAAPAVRQSGSSRALYSSSRDGASAAGGRGSSERRRMEQSHHRSLGARGASSGSLFYFDEGGIQDRLRGPGYDAAAGKLANAVLGLKPLELGPTGDREKAERSEIAKLAGWEGRLQQMEEKRKKEKAAALAAPPIGVGAAASGTSASSSGSTAGGSSSLFVAPPPIASDQFAVTNGGGGAGGEEEIDPVARADAMLRGDSLYSDLESKYRSV